MTSSRSLAHFPGMLLLVAGCACQCITAWAQQGDVAVHYDYSSRRGKTSLGGRRVPDTPEEAGRVEVSVPAQGNPCSVADTLSVLVWNVERMPYGYGTIDGEAEGRTKRLEPYIQRAIDADRTDIFILQEVRVGVHADSGPGHGYSFFHASGYFDPKTGAGLGTAIVATRRVDSVLFQQSDARAFLNTGMPKAVVYAWMSVSDSGQRLLVVSIHAMSMASTRAFRKQMRQVFEVLGNHRGPVILAGDFNTWSKARMRMALDTFTPLGLRIVGDDRFVGEKRKSWRGRPLDHVFLRGVELQGDIHVGATHGLSDHAPLYFRVRL